MSSGNSAQIFWRDMAIAALVFCLAIAVLISATFAFPSHQNILHPIAGSLTGASFGLVSAAFAQRRTTEHFFNALQMSKIKNPNILDLRAEYAAYKYLYWKTIKVKKDGSAAIPAWSVTEIQWQQYGDLPFFTGFSDVSDIEDDDTPRAAGDRKRYQHLLFLTKGRFVLLTSPDGSNEPTGVHVFWHPTSGDTLVGHLRHVTWTGDEALSPCILSERAHHDGKRVTPPKQPVLDTLWSRLQAGKIKDNLVVMHTGNQT